MSAGITAVRGMNDILPGESERWEALEDVLRAWLRGYGYRNIRTPILEQTALFRRAIGETTDIVEKEMYSFVDDLNGERLTMRPEATASTVRAAIEHSLLYPGPQRLYYFGQMFRHERPQKGRYRQFHQVGAEAMGFAGPDIDAEQMLMCQRLWDDLGLSGISLHINSLGSLPERVTHREALVAYLRDNEAYLDEDSRRRMHANPLRVLDSKNPDLQGLIAGAPRLLDYLGDDSLKHFDGVQTILKDAGIAYVINPRLVRGLDYYNLTVFEWVTDKLGAQGTVCGGGRYDGLMEQLGGKPAPACGWAMGIERLLALMAKEGQATDAAGPDVYLVNQGELASRSAFRVAEDLRAAGFEVVQHCGGGSFKSQMKKADASGAWLAVILGDDEVAAGEATLKPLREEKAQQRVKIAAIADAVGSHLFQEDEA
ncbi:MAG: histidine--tRNA ligase [Betaproteobacteria bacterium]|nr:histidine--tRNA ligase [Betaproteobacteria bacterium]